MHRYRMLFVQTSTRPPNMHLKLTKHEKFCKQNNQLPTQSHGELEDNSKVLMNLQLVISIKLDQPVHSVTSDRFSPDDWYCVANDQLLYPGELLTYGPECGEKRE